jgi:hypothetical protein
MSLDKTLKKLLAEKQSLLSTIELSCKSIEFWEKKADRIFKKMDDLESETLFTEDEATEKQHAALVHETNRLMNRINFENNELDRLEKLILDLEEKIVTTLARYAKKQKK